MVSSTHNVCAKDIYVAIVSTIIETDRPEMEIAPGLQLLGPIHDKYVISVHSGYTLTLFSQIRINQLPVHPNFLWCRRQYLHHEVLRRDIAL